MEPGINHFPTETLRRLIASEGKTVSAVICYMWLNRMNPNDIVQLIDNVEFRFSDGSHIIVSANDENEGLEVLNDFDLAHEQMQLEKEFNGKIKIVPVDAAKTKMWEEIPGRALTHVGLTKDGDHYLNDSIQLNFGDERRIIQLSPMDGLIIDYYED